MEYAKQIDSMSSEALRADFNTTLGLMLPRRPDSGRPGVPAA
ncbi:MAG: hypothetical protein ACOY41_04335 [Pseudomonadota bacterium]